jgi:glycosyltransferase involved in cell wall biosynthesis
VPKLSIIVTAYNIEAFIDECLRDIAGQTLRDIEIIVVDDGSSDGTPDRIRAFAGRDPRIVPLLQSENSIGGVATAANIGMDRATGEFIGFADGDDRYDPTMFEKLVHAAEANHAELAMCSYVTWDAETGQTAQPPDATRWTEIAADGVVTLDTAGRRRVLALNAVPWRKVYAARLLRDSGIRFPVGDFFFEDNPFHWFSVLSANRVAFVDEALCRHRVNRIGQTTATVDRKLLRMFRHHAIIKRWIEENGHDADFRLDLLVWAARQLSWIGRKCPPELRDDLFREVQGIVALHDPQDIATRETQDAVGKRTAALLRAAQAEDQDAFGKLLDQAAARTPKRRDTGMPKSWARALFDRIRRN